MSTEVINFKVIVLGYQGVGKSCMIMRYIKGKFAEQYNVTVGVEYASKNVTIDEKTIVRLQIWDTLFRSVVRTFYKGISAAFFVYGIDRYKSFEYLTTWYKYVRENSHYEIVLFLIGARSDLYEYRQVTAERATYFLKSIGGVFYIYVSAKNGINVDTKAAMILHKKYVSNGAFRNLVRPVLASGISARAESMRLTQYTNQQSKRKCC